MQLLYDALVIIGLLLAIFITFVSSYIIIFFFGEKYSSSIDVIKIYAWVSIFYFLSSASGRWYINEKLQMFALTRNLLGLLVGAALNYILIPIYGIVGSAYATLIAYFCAAYLFDVSNRKTRISFYQKSKALWIPGAIFRLRKSLLNKGLV
jgi:O-antigen/teichoic acid export membrane protein